MRDKLQDAFRATRTTTVLVSHDLEEAVYLADQVLLLTRPPTPITEIVPLGVERPPTRNR
jgi:NitT/TauT family transport system ATP-binding protein